jgi:hypothetical protein
VKGTWQTDGDSGSGALGELAAVVLGVALIAAVAVPLINALASLLEVLAVIVGALVLLGSVCLVCLLRFQARRSRPVTATVVSPARPAFSRPLGAPQRPAVEGKRELHLHFHGVDAEDVSAILDGVNRKRS